MTSVAECRRLSGMKTKRVSNEEFIKIWQSALTLSEVAEKVGKPNSNCTLRAVNLRNRHGIPLKMFRINNYVDKEGLTKLALKYAPK